MALPSICVSAGKLAHQQAPVPMPHSKSVAQRAQCAGVAPEVESAAAVAAVAGMVGTVRRVEGGFYRHLKFHRAPACTSAGFFRMH